MNVIYSVTLLVTNRSTTIFEQYSKFQYLWKFKYVCKGKRKKVVETRVGFLLTFLDPDLLLISSATFSSLSNQIIPFPIHKAKTVKCNVESCKVSQSVSSQHI